MTAAWTREEYAQKTLRQLTAEHHELIVSSAISLEVAAARGYYSAIHQVELRRIGFSNAMVPALVLPLRDVRGELAGYQIRPDQAPVDRYGRVAKYLTKRGAPPVLDVPPTIRHLLGSPKPPLLITEGARKADAAASQGVCCLSLQGVFNFRGRNDAGGVTMLADWEHVHLRGRPAVLAFDSDVMVKQSVHLALSRLRTWLESRGAEVYIAYLPVGQHGEKMGLDDWLAAGHDKQELNRLLTTELRPPAASAVSSGDRPDGLRSVGDDETTWYLRFPERGELALTTAELRDWEQVVSRCMERFNWLPQWDPSRAEWKACLDRLIVDAPREAAIPGLSRQDRIVAAVRHHLRRADDRPELVMTQGVWRSEEHHAFVLRAEAVIGECRTIWPTVREREVHRVLREEMGATSERIYLPNGSGPKQTRVLLIPLDATDETEEAASI